MSNRTYRLYRDGVCYSSDLHNQSIGLHFRSHKTESHSSHLENMVPTYRCISVDGKQQGHYNPFLQSLF